MTGEQARADILSTLIANAAEIDKVLAQDSSVVVPLAKVRETLIGYFHAIEKLCDMLVQFERALYAATSVPREVELRSAGDPGPEKDKPRFLRPDSHDGE